jgi:hypothetical protein
MQLITVLLLGTKKSSQEIRLIYSIMFLFVIIKWSNIYHLFKQKQNYHLLVESCFNYPYSEL